MPQLSVVVPVFNERDNIPPLLAEIATALRGKVDFEVVYVDDDSSDDSVAVLAAEKSKYPELRIVRHLTRSGQSTAVWNGVNAARSPWIATLDGDGQNDPADIPKLLAQRDQSTPDVRLFAGWRTTRRDSFNKRISSKVANAVRSRMLRDSTPDTGCGLKLFDREVFLRLP
ncbi:glycosyltransferase [Dyella terrae]|nr:glycosyltransferase [Dyella terrae]